MLHRIKTPGRAELAKIFKDPRTLKAFESMFEVLPEEFEYQQEVLEQIQATAESAQAQAVLAFSLLQAIQTLTEVKSLEPQFQCSCSFDDLSPRYEAHQSEDVAPRYESVGADHPEPTHIHHHEISTLEIV